MSNYSEKNNVTYGADELSSNSSLPIEHEEVASNKDNIFKDPVIYEHYTQVYEDAKYECRHLLDPDFEWTPEEEKKIVWKLEWRCCFVAFLFFFNLDIDRGNISSALADNMLTDLKLTTNDYNLGSTINLICFLSSELPSQLVSKKLGPDVWIPLQMVLFSIVAMSQAAIKTRPAFFATRALLGALQGGFIPDICLWLSYFYKNNELPVRLGYFYIANPATAAVTSLMAYGIFHMDGRHGIEGWRWMFLLEGICTFAVGIAAFFLMPPSVVQTKTWFRPKGWFTEREEKIQVNRILRDDPTKGKSIIQRQHWALLTLLTIL